MSHPWDELLGQALLGLERRSLELPKSPTVLGQQLHQLEQANLSAPLSLLHALAITGFHWRIGQIPARLEVPEPEPATTDERPHCSEASAQYLRQMLTFEFGQVLPEFLTEVARVKQRLPDQLLPELLERARQQTDLRPLVNSVAGPRGHWLARQNSAWEFATQLSLLKLESEWETAPREGRLNTLIQLRQTDPAAGRERLTQSWAQEKATDRAAFISILALGVSEADEPFLEQALDDRSKEVRLSAAGVLAKLPTSQFSQRMQRQAQNCLFWVMGRLKNKRLSVQPPEQVEPALQRDSVETKPKAGRGEKAHWLGEIVAAVPTHFWRQHLQIAPPELIREIEKSEWRAVLIESWAQAAERDSDAEWAEALLAATFEKEVSIHLARLFELLPTERREAFVLQALKSKQVFDEAHPFFRLLGATHSQWTLAASELLLSILTQLIQRDKSSYPGHFILQLPSLALQLHPDIAPAAQAQLLPTIDQKPPWLSKAVTEFLSILQFRHAMLIALHSRNTP